MLDMNFLISLILLSMNVPLPKLLNEKQLKTISDLLQAVILFDILTLKILTNYKINNFHMVSWALFKNYSSIIKFK